VHCWKKQKAEGVSHRLVRFEIDGRGIPRHEYEIANEKNESLDTLLQGQCYRIVKRGLEWDMFNRLTANLVQSFILKSERIIWRQWL